MKRMALLALLLALLLCGCRELTPKEYLSITPHQEDDSQSARDDAVTAENYLSLKNAILGFIREGQSEGIIRIANYKGDVEKELTEAVYEVSRLDPLGAYAVDFMTHEVARIVSYYEAKVHITYRRTVQEIEQIISVATTSLLVEQLQQALDRGDSRMTVRVAGYREHDLAAEVAAWVAGHPETMMELPAVTVSVYPETGVVRIVEVELGYTNSLEQRQIMQGAVAKSLDGAAEYIRYRKTETEKCRLLFTYLTERFPYAQAETATPLYSALCYGIADQQGLATAWQLICDRAGIDCYTVTGIREGQPYTWNIVSQDGYYRHLDLSRCILEAGALVFHPDDDMGAYYWDTAQYPACELPPPPPPPPVEEETEITEE